MTLIDLLDIIVTAPLGDIYMLMLTKPRYSWKKLVVLVSLFSIANIFVNIAMVFFLPVSPPKYLVRLLFVGYGWLFTIIISDYKGFRNVFAFLTACTFYEIQSLFSTIFYLVSQNQYPYARILCKLLAFLIIVEILYRFVRKPFLYILEQSEIDWKRFCTIPLTLTISFFLLDSYPSPLMERPQNIPAALSLCLAIILFNTMQFILFQQMQVNFQAVKNMADMKMQVIALQKQMKAKEKTEKKLRIFQHDLRHVANAISACMTNENYKEAETLLSSLNRTIGEIRPAQVSYCENSIMNAVISMFVQSAKAEGIEVTVKTAFPENFGINYEELSVVFANAMENAIHACRKLKEGEEKALRLTCAPSGKQLFIEIANTYAGGVEFDKTSGAPISRREGHGIGAQSIAAFAERHRGILLYNTSENWFLLRLILPKQETEKNCVGGGRR